MCPISGLLTLNFGPLTSCLSPSSVRPDLWPESPLASDLVWILLRDPVQRYPRCFWGQRVFEDQLSLCVDSEETFLSLSPAALSIGTTASVGGKYQVEAEAPADVFMQGDVCFTALTDEKKKKKKRRRKKEYLSMVLLLLSHLEQKDSLSCSKLLKETVVSPSQTPNHQTTCSHVYYGGFKYFWVKGLLLNSSRSVVKPLYWAVNILMLDYTLIFQCVLYLS